MSDDTTTPTATIEAERPYDDGRGLGEAVGETVREDRVLRMECIKHAVLATERVHPDRRDTEVLILARRMARFAISGTTPNIVTPAALRRAELLDLRKLVDERLAELDKPATLAALVEDFVQSQMARTQS